MKIAGLLKLSLIDFPDGIGASLFLAGCNLDCGFCHNRWMIHERDVPEAISVDAFFEWLETRSGLLDGVCISGGEPTIHTDLAELCGRIKRLDMEVKLDTNGTLPERVARLLDDGLIDYVAMDVKAPLDDRYGRVARVAVDTDAIRRSMDLIRAAGIEYEFRTTVTPELGYDDLADIGRELKSGDTWVLQAFRAAEGVDPGLSQDDAADEDTLRDWAARLDKDSDADVGVRGG